MKILFATPYKNITGGISRWAQNIINYYRLNSFNIDIDILSFDDSQKHDAEYYISKGFFERIYRGLRLYGHSIKVMIDKINVSKYDILHIASSATLGLFRDIVMIHLAHRKGIKCVVHFHFGRIPELSFQKNWEWMLLTYVVRIADKTIVMDKTSFDTLLSHNYKNVEYVPNPLSPAVNYIINNHVNITRQRNLVLFAGQCVQAKGIYELVEACRDIPCIELRMYGAITDHVEADLKKIWGTSFSTLRIMKNRAFDEVILAMRQCDIFVLPSYTEGFPNVMLESMACGCAIVATSVGSIPEMLECEDGRHYGIMVPARNVQDLKSAIIRMLSDHNFANQCRANVQERVNDRYNVRTVCNKITEIWRQLI